MKNFPPSISPFDFVASANLVGLTLAKSDFTDDELNAISEWLMQVGQYLATYLAQRQLLQGREKIEEEKKKNKGNDYGTLETH